MTAGWDAIDAAVETVRAELAAIAPDPAVLAESEAYIARTVASSIGDIFLGHQFTENGLTRSLPTKGGPNPDYLMCHSLIDPEREYRLEGRLNDSERVGVGLYSFGVDGATILAGYAVFDRKNIGADGRFTLDLAANASGPGTLTITPDCRVLLIRTLHRAPAGRPSTLVLTGGTGSPKLVPDAAGTDGALAWVAKSIIGGARQFIEWSRLISAHPNRFITPPPSIAKAVQGDPDTCYAFSYYDLAPGSWLEATMPAGVNGYWSLHAYNFWLESLPGTGVHDLNAAQDADGRIRVRIGPDSASGVVNRIDTGGRNRGILIYRAIGSASGAIPEAALRR